MKKLISFCLSLLMILSLLPLFAFADSIENAEQIVESAQNAPSIYLENNVVRITEAENIRAITYALGGYSTSSDISADKNSVYIGSTKIKSYISNGTVNISLSESGLYTFYVVMNDSVYYFLHIRFDKSKSAVPQFSINSISSNGNIFSIDTSYSNSCRLTAQLYNKKGNKLLSTVSKQLESSNVVKNEVISLNFDCDISQDNFVKFNILDNSNNPITKSVFAYCSGAYTWTGMEKQGDIILMGSYPQREVTDNALISALTAVGGNWISYDFYISYQQSDYMVYKDVVYNGEKYRCVKFTQYRPNSSHLPSSLKNSVQDDNGFFINKEYWFKFEPIKWKVLDPSTRFVLSCNSIDSREFYHDYGANRTIGGKTVYSNNYEYSDIRSWLNEDFYNIAFTEAEKSGIEVSTINNTCPTSSKFNCNTTYDKIFLLSNEDAKNSQYGFSTTYSSKDTQRAVKTTDYASSLGNINSIADYYTYTCWYLRTPGYYSNYSYRVFEDGTVDDDFNVDITTYGIVPAMHLSEPKVEPELSTDNYNVLITEADNISSIRFAPGEYATASEIKTAEGKRDIVSDDITDNTFDGVFIYEMQSGGIYSFAVKMKDGSEYVFKADLTHFTQELSSVDNILTVSNLYGVSSILFAQGYYDDYYELKDNLTYSVTSKKLNGAKKYSYEMPDDSTDVTVYIKYLDTTRPAEFLYTTLTTPHPTITANGLDITIDNLTDVKCIKRTFGSYSTLAEVKKSAGVVTYTSEVTSGTDKATLHIPHEGTTTLSIQYKSGYTAILNVEIIKKTPTFTQDGNKVTIGNIDDLYIVRYAKGTFEKVNQIKNAPGAKYLKSDAIDENGQIIIESLDKGIYTFLVQFDDQSQNLYTITVE